MPRSISAAVAGNATPAARRPLQMKLDAGSASSLHMDCNTQFNQVAVGGRTIFKIFSILEDRFEESVNMRSAKSVNLNYSCNDVIWNKLDPTVLATAATNGAIVVWNLTRYNKPGFFFGQISGTFTNSELADSQV